MQGVLKLKKKFRRQKLNEPVSVLEIARHRIKSEYVKILSEAFVESLKGAIRPMILRDRKTRKAQWVATGFRT